MNQHFRDISSVPADNAITDPKLEFANKWMEGVVVKGLAAFGGDGAFFLINQRTSTRPVKDEWSIVPIAQLTAKDFIAELASFDLPPDNVEPFQPALDFPATFLPSGKLVSIWIDGLAEFAKDGDRVDVDATIFNLSPSQRSEALIKRLSYVVASYAHQRKYESLPSVPLTSGDRFDLNFQLVLSEFLPLIPDRSADFLSLLHQELKSAFQAGWKLENSEWGKVECIGPNIMLKLQIPETFDDPDFEPSIEG